MHTFSRKFVAIPVKFQVILEVLINLSQNLLVFMEIYSVILYWFMCIDGRTGKINNKRSKGDANTRQNNTLC
jgi:hypothetical protein